MHFRWKWIWKKKSSNMAYSTKFASGYYGPFRDVAESTPSFGIEEHIKWIQQIDLKQLKNHLKMKKEGADIYGKTSTCIFRYCKRY